MILANYAGLSVEWQVNCYNKCSEPFLLRAVNAHASAAEQSGGGFYSLQFWIHSVDSFSKTATSSTNTPSVTGGLVPTTSSLHTSNPTSTTPSTPEASTSSASGGHHGNNSSTPIGVGVGVGVGVALLLVGGFFIWRRYHKRMKEKYSHSSPLEIDQPHSSWQQSPGNPATDVDNHFPVSEAYAPEAKPLAEAPDRSFDPQELPGHTL